MIIDMNNAPKLLLLGDLESGEVFQFPLNPDDYYMASSSLNRSKDQRSYINLSSGVISTDFTCVAVKRVSARLTNKVD